MSVEDNLEVVRRVAETLPKRDCAGFEALFADKIVPLP